ncbi:hypothetical protein Q3G72_021765 [Acer saccharum]|nr:hypothetical protein Q3G72_021765 [Acer saccharum]
MVVTNYSSLVGAGVLGLPYALSQLGCYQVFAMPVFDLIESYMYRSYIANQENLFDSSVVVHMLGSLL